MAKKKVKLEKVEEATVVNDPLQEFYVKAPGMKSTFIKVYGLSKLDVGRDYAGYDFENSDPEKGIPPIRICKDVYTYDEMVEKGYFQNIKSLV